MIISVWSSTKKSGKTIFIYSLIHQLLKTVSEDVNILASCMNLDFGNLLRLFKIDDNELNIEDIVNYKLYSENNFNIFNTLAKKDNVYLIGSKKTNSSYANRNMQIFENVIEEFRETFDLVLIDLISGTENSLTNMIIEKSDHVLNIITQDIESLNSRAFVNDKDIAYVVNRYKNIYPNTKDLEQIYKIKNIFTLPQCDELQEMKNKDRIDYYANHHDTEYNSAVKELAQFLVGKLKIEVKRDATVKVKRRNIFGGVFK